MKEKEPGFKRQNPPKETLEGKKALPRVTDSTRVIHAEENNRESALDDG
ncbi:MAG: hypothetical protein FWE85_01535 [Clostridiales bacterium]|nr:hypothetical protein [Clostridiales bacterium]